MTFQVDMSTYEGAFGTVNLNGNFNGWCGGCAEMTDADGDGVYSLMFHCRLVPSSMFTWMDGLPKKDSTVQSLARLHLLSMNRAYEVAGEATLDVVCCNSCDACEPQTASEYAVTFRGT